MQIVDSHQVIVTTALRECRDFYVKWFDFEVAFEASWFVLLSSSGEHSTSIAFMHPEHPSSPPSPGAFRGDGSFLTLQVTDATAAYMRVTDTGLRPDLPLTDEPWGQRRRAGGIPMSRRRRGSGQTTVVLGADNGPDATHLRWRPA